MQEVSVVFSFFRKKDSDTDTGTHAPDTAARTPAKSAPTDTAPPMLENDSDGLSGIEVSNGDSLLTPAEEQAAILYANGGSDAAARILEADLPSLRSQRRLETWLMLFDLYQKLGDRAAFDNLGLEYVVEFEKTPPIWQQQKAAPAKQAQATGNTCTFSSSLTANTIDKELVPFRNSATRIEPLRLDFSRTKEIDSVAAAELLSIWALAKKVVASRQVLGGASFAALLSGKIATGRRIPAEAPFWLVLMELYQAMGKQEEFENIAIEYAVTFEVSPPSWDARLAPKMAAEMESTQALPAKNHEGLLLSAEITAKKPQGLDEIRDYAQSHPGEILLDFEYVDRIDFESAGQLLNLFMQLLQSGHQVRIVQANELVLSLLRLMSVTELVTVERRKS